MSLGAQAVHTSLRANANPFPQHRRYAQVWAEGNYAYVGSDASYGVLVFDVSNPDSPVLVANYNPGNAISNDIEDVQIRNGIGYFASNLNGGVHIVDLSDPTHPQLISRITSAQGGADSVHNIFVDDGNFLYEPDYGKSPRVFVFDVSNPANPVLVDTITTTDPNWIHAMMVHGNHLYTSGSGGRTDIWDVTNVGTGQAALLGSFDSGFRGVHAWPTSDDHYLYSSREITTGADIRIFDISDPSNVVQVGSITGGPLGFDAVAPSNVVVAGNRLYATWDQVGMVIFDITNPAAPVLIGGYDTWPGAVNATQFDGGWGLFPFLGPDRVLMTDRDSGLYVIDTTGASTDPALYNFKLSAATAPGNATVTGTAYLAGVAGDGGFQVNINTDAFTLAPPVATAFPGTTNGTVSVTTVPVTASTSSTVSASDAANTFSARVTVTPPKLTALQYSLYTVVGGNSVTGKVLFDGPAAVDTQVPLTVKAGASALNAFPASVLLPAGSSLASWTIATNPVSVKTTVTISAALNGVTKSTNLTVNPNLPSTIILTPSTLTGGASSTGRVNFSPAVTADTVVTLAVVTNPSVVAAIPASVTALAGSSSVSFSIATNEVSAPTAAQISATANGSTRTATLTANPNWPTAVSFIPASVVGGGSTTGKVTFGRAVSSPTTVTLSVITGAGVVSSIPATVTVAQGATSATWAMGTVDVPASTPVQVAAAANGGSKTGTLTVNPNTPTAVSFSPASVIGGANSTGKVTFARPVAQATVVTLTVMNGASAVNSIPASVTVPAGSNNATWIVSTAAGSGPASVQISASANGGTKTGTLTVN